MSRFTHQIKSYWQQLRTVMGNEYRTIFTDGGAMLVLVFALLIYATAYSLAYAPQVLRNVPIGVIDQCRTPTSRSLIETFDAGPNTVVAFEPTDMQEARKLFFERKIYGVVYIPSDYEQKLLGGQQAVVGIYCDASYFLMYRQVFQELVTTIGKTGAMVEFQRLIAKGANIPQAQATTQPVIYQAHNIFNPYLGYGTFVMPAIIMVIIQQTLLIGIGMVGGTWRERRLYRKLVPSGAERMSVVPLVLGKSAAYVSIYTLTLLYVLGFHYKLFGYPMNGRPGDIVLFLLPYVLSCTFMGIALSSLFKYRENSLIFLLFTSIPFLMLSGVSIPEQAMPGWLFRFGKIVPSSSGVDGFVRIQTMGATLSEVGVQFRTLWILTGVYFVLACAGMRNVLLRVERKEPPRTEKSTADAKQQKTIETL